MSILGKANYENKEEKYKTAQQYLDTVLALLPDYTDFRTEDVIRERIEDPALREKLDACHIQITAILTKLGYVQIPAGKSVKLELTEPGRRAKAAGGHAAYQAEIEKRSRPLTQNIGTNYGIAAQDSNVRLQAFQPTINPPTTPITDAPNTGTKTSFGKWMLNNIWLIIAAIIATVIGGYILFHFGWN